MEFKHVDLTKAIIGAFCDVYNIELKSTKKLASEHKAQLLNYLKAIPYEVGLLLNFGPKPKHLRKAFDNSRKPNLSMGQKRTRIHADKTNINATFSTKGGE